LVFCGNVEISPDDIYYYRDGEHLIHHVRSAAGDPNLARQLILSNICGEARTWNAIYALDELLIASMLETAGVPDTALPLYGWRVAGGPDYYTVTVALNRDGATERVSMLKDPGLIMPDGHVFPWPSDSVWWLHLEQGDARYHEEGEEESPL
jgi:hypothetical protein